MSKNLNFSERLEKITPEILSKIGQIEALKGEWIAGARPNPQVLGRLKKFDKLEKCSENFEQTRLWADFNVRGGISIKPMILKFSKIF